VTDQVAEVAGWLEHVQFGLNGDTTPEAYAKAQYAARLIATLAAEVEDARQFNDHNAANKNTLRGQVSYEVSKYRVTRRATDALLAEVKR
jgi:hypothetical protein